MLITEAMVDAWNYKREFLQNNRIGFHNPNYQPKKFEFMHVPKCAGTSVGAALSTVPGMGDLKHRPISIVDFVRICCGEPIETNYITVVRHPVLRVWSYYNMIKQKGHFSWGKYSTSLDTFLDKCWEVNNMMLQYLICSPRQNLFSMDDFESAKKSFSKFYFKIDMDYLNDDWERFRLKINTDFDLDPGALPYLNQSPSYGLPSDKQIEKIKVHNQWDLRLYEIFLREA